MSISPLYTAYAQQAALSSTARTMPGQPVQTSTPAQNAADTLGVSVHCFIAGTNIPLMNETDFDLIQAAGFKKVRLDMLWANIEKQPGRYDFSQYDRVIRQLEQRGLQPVAILGLGNPLYGPGQSVYPDRTREAFSRYAQATVEHFKNRNVIWELINEPNDKTFWQPAPNPVDYAKFALDLIPRLKTLDRSGVFIAPSTAGIDLNFLEQSFRHGVLNVTDAVSIHPFPARGVKTNPEQMEKDYVRARQLIERYRPAGRQIPLLISEGGYSSVNGEFDELTHANYLVRQALLNIANGSPASVLYDWKGDSDGEQSAYDVEGAYGLVANNTRLKPAYFAFREMIRAIDGQRFVERVPSNPSDYLLRFENDDQKTLAAWTTDSAHPIQYENMTLQISGKPLFIKRQQANAQAGQ